MELAEFNKAFGEWAKENEELSHAVSLNVVRDWMWTFLSYDLLNIRLHATNDGNFDINSQYAGQQLYSTAAMAAFAALCRIGYWAYQNCCSKVEESSDANSAEQSLNPNQQQTQSHSFPKADVAALLAGAATAIYTWDKGQAWGIQLGTQLGLSPAGAGYFASILTGVFEGPTQMLVISLMKLLIKNTEWTKFKNDPIQYMKDKAKELGLSMTLGAIPGAVWQIVFNAGVLANLGPIATSFAVAAAVAACNVGYAKISTAILKSECCINLCGKPADPAANDSELEQHEAPCATAWNALTNCCFGFFNSCNGSKYPLPVNDNSRYGTPSVQGMQ